MEVCTVYFWNAGPGLRLSAAEVIREINFGEDVDGLIDLPIKDLLERIKQAFPQHEEHAGLFIGQGSVGSFEVTWTWQHLKASVQGLPLSDRQRLIETIEDAGCTAYEAP